MTVQPCGAQLSQPRQTRRLIQLARLRLWELLGGHTWLRTFILALTNHYAWFWRSDMFVMATSLKFLILVGFMVIFGICTDTQGRLPQHWQSKLASCPRVACVAEH